MTHLKNRILAILFVYEAFWQQVVIYMLYASRMTAVLAL